MDILNKLFLLLTVLALNGCGSQSAEQARSNNRSNEKSSEDANKKSSAKKRSTDPTEDGASDSGDNDDQTDGDPSESEARGEEYFNVTLVPILQAQCVQCHADPRQTVQVRGPLTIYSYKSMRPKIADGRSPLDNAFINMINGISAHTGGNRCQNGMGVSPCKELVEWWRMEFGDDDDGTGGARLGLIDEVSSFGRVVGWAVNPADLNESVAVNFYLDGPAGTGVAIGSVVANRDGPDGNNPGAHAFSFDLPAMAKNQREREIFAYAVIEGEEFALNEAAFKFTAYDMSDAGRQFYQQNVQRLLGGCAGCHTVSYEQQFYSLISPPPNKGGVAANNLLLNKAAQVNGVTHGGGAQCNGANAGLCAQVQAWWNIEFGAASN